MPVVNVEGVDIAYEVEGEGIPLILLHGFASTAADNFGRTGWVQALTRTGRQVVAIDLRGHGKSGHPHEEAAYAGGQLVDDVIAVLDELGIAKADLMGFSMGAGLAMRLASQYGDRFDKVVLAGVGGKMLAPRGDGWSEKVVEALTTDDPESIDDPTAKGFRLYAEHLAQDRLALAACMKAPGSGRDVDFSSIASDVLVIAGARDDLAGDPAELAAVMPRAKAEIVPGTDHMFLLANPMCKGMVIDFLTGWE